MIDFQSKGYQIAAAVRGGKISATEALQVALARIDTANPSLNAFTAITSERARAKAAAIDQAIDEGRDAGPLAGVCFAVKNLFDVAGLSTLAGSKINRDDPPAQGDATLVRRLEAAGAILVGALNMGEYAYDFTGENIHYGPSRNPHDPTCMSGGSSGGSGTSVASGMVPLALGSDTNGSIRVPASLCGLFGLKPTFGRLSRHGSFPFVADLDHLGPMTRSVTDLALSYDAMQGPDENDLWCAQKPAEPVIAKLNDGIGDLRIAVADDYFAKQGDPEVHEAVAAFARALNTDRRITIPEAGRGRAAAYVITTVEGANLHRERLKTRPNDFDPAVRDRFLAGLMLPSDWLAQAHRFRAWYRARVAEVFRDVDIILAPATPRVAPKLGQVLMTLNGVEMPVRANLGLFTQPISAIGLPVVTAPWAERDGKLPIGVQIIAAPWKEELALRVARHLENIGIAASKAV
ncbi:AtzE family amidohydrolase [Ferrovibrio sp.]|uniref:AtzE family amidohydrolase n=1 Tax=Ferrovibrio sp. TaxID=1917215 RepID=UPI000CB12A8F|nr:AtzE family amidohydrolase [Ferrovibrio sp.]PJI40936.1 MAG: Asp-tRNA(Asn)/Glu-tRNA(Gln) amidotransferase GatCAB subunit A [Ferrovibrio sp.]